VRTSIEIDAPPETVWHSVVRFSEISAKPEFIFRIGVACPLRAEIVGTGIGAVRHCVFTTGPFVEPITAWDPPHRLAFDVAESPSPLEEFSPYPGIHPPHLDFLRSHRGEFQLLPAPHGKTILTGTTWYSHDIAPDWYWDRFSDHIIHRIHHRVLDHIKTTAEAGQKLPQLLPPPGTPVPLY
jgi:hypothetical protein